VRGLGHQGVLACHGLAVARTRGIDGHPTCASLAPQVFRCTHTLLGVARSALLAVWGLHLTMLLLSCCLCSPLHAIASYYAIVPLSLLPSDWFQQQHWRQLPANAVEALAPAVQHLQQLPAQLNRLQRLVSRLGLGAQSCVVVRVIQVVLWLSVPDVHDLAQIPLPCTYQLLG
jgi:hypothetical protein